MKALPSTERACRGRGIGWALVQRKGMITVRAFKRDSTGQSFMAEQSACLLFLSNCETPRSLLANLLLAVRAQVRWAVSQVEFERQGLRDSTPNPWRHAPTGMVWEPGHWGFDCAGKLRQGLPRLVPAMPPLQLGKWVSP